MRYIFLFILTIMTAGSLSAQNLPETMVSERAHVFLKTASINRLVNSVNYFLNDLSDPEFRNLINSSRTGFKNRTGVDYLDEYSLGKLGVDTARPLCFAVLPPFRGNGMYLIMIPVKDEKSFPMKFVEVVRNSNSRGKEVYPVITPYRDHSIYQLRNDVFTSSVNGYFLISSNGDILREIINRKNLKGKSLAYNHDFMLWQSGKPVTHDVNIFFSKDYIVQITLGRDMVTAKKSNVKGQGKTVEEKPGYIELLERLKFVAGGFSFVEKDFVMRFSTFMDLSKNDISDFMEIMKTGSLSEAALPGENISGFFFSVDLKRMESICRKKSSFCREYVNFKNRFKGTTGVDFEKDIVPASTGMVNVYSDFAFTDSGKGKLALYFPMGSSRSISGIWKKMTYQASKKKRKTKYRSMKINGMRAFSIVSEGDRMFVVRSQKGILAGNDPGLLKSVMVSTGKTGKIKVPGNAFLYSVVRKNDYLYNLMKQSEQAPSFFKGFFEKFEASQLILLRERNSLIMEAKVSFK